MAERLLLVRARTRGLSVALQLVAALGMAACAAPASRPGAGPPAAQLAAMSRGDAVWLERVSFGLDSGTVSDYRRLGRERYLDQQLQPEHEILPAPIAGQVQALESSRPEAAPVLQNLQQQRKAVNAMTDGADKDQARKALNDEGNQAAYEARRRELLRAIYSPAQLEEQMVWFWLNHFSVYQYKANLRWLIADYSERAIRPHALGHFRDLVLATLEHPAMLQYLDNARTPPATSTRTTRAS